MIEKMITKTLGFGLLVVLAVNAIWLLSWFILSATNSYYVGVKEIAIAMDMYALVALFVVIAFYFVLGMLGDSGWSLLDWHHKMTKNYGLMFYAGLLCLVAVMYMQSWVLAAFAIFFYLSMLSSGQSKQLSGSSKSNTSVTESRKSSINFSSVIGLEDTKNRLLKAGRQIIAEHQRKKADNDVARNGILLFGPAGTGKTFLAEALAGELGLGFMHFNFSQANSKWIGESTERVTEVFKQAMAHAPILLFLDEVDTVFVNRAGIAQAEHESGRLTSALLPLIEEARKKGVVLVAATNLFDRLDPASIREGRFDFKIEVGYPDAKARKAIVASALLKHGVSVLDGDIEKASSRWEGYAIPRLTSVAAELSDSGIFNASFLDLMQAMRRVKGRKGTKVKTHKLEDLILSKNAREELESLVWRLKHVDELEERGGSLPTGLLFYGDPGSGKGMTAVAIANSADWAFLSVTGQELLSDESKIDELMAEAAEVRPVLVFIDEAEDVFAHRRGGFANTVTNKLLAVMDGVKSKAPDVIFIAATNHPDQIDSAALRGGRFTEKVLFTYPERPQTLEFVQRWLSSKPQLTLGSDLTVECLVQQVQGISFANLNAILQTAANTVISRNCSEISHSDISLAKTKVLVS